MFSHEGLDIVILMTKVCSSCLSYSY